MTLTDSGKATIIAVATLAVMALFAAGAWSIWNSMDFTRQSNEERQIANMERFSWASPECVAQEVYNPGYRNNEQNIRLCQLETQIEEMRLQIDADIPSDTP